MAHVITLMHIECFHTEKIINERERITSAYNVETINLETRVNNSKDERKIHRNENKQYYLSKALG